MPWEVLTGVVEWWADEGLRDVGRRRFREVGGNPSSRAAISLGTIDRVRAAFIARRSPWRLSEVALDYADEMTPAIASWADHATAVLNGSPVQQHVVGPHESWGDFGVRQMLCPAALEAIVPMPWPGQFQIPGGAIGPDISTLAALVSLGTSYYDVRFDSDLEIISAWTAVIDGDAAQRVAISQVTSIAAGFPR
jgi:hypothetical protein